MSLKINHLCALNLRVMKVQWDHQVIKAKWETLAMMDNQEFLADLVGLARVKKVNPVRQVHQVSLT